MVIRRSRSSARTVWAITYSMSLSIWLLPLHTTYWFPVQMRSTLQRWEASCVPCAVGAAPRLFARVGCLRCTALRVRFGLLSPWFWSLTLSKSLNFFSCCSNPSDRSSISSLRLSKRKFAFSSRMNTESSSVARKTASSTGS